MAISRRVGERFRKALYNACIQGTDHEVDRRFVENILRGIAPETTSMLGKVVSGVCSYDTLTEIAKEEGATFRETLKLAAESGQHEAVTYVRRIVAMYEQAIGAHPGPQVHRSQEEPKPPPAKATEVKAGDARPAQCDTAPSGSPISPPDGAAREFSSVHIYNIKSAICLQIDQNRDMEHVVRIEGALKVNNDFDWKNKIAIQLTVGEVSLYLAVMYGWTQKVELFNHGANHDKFATIERQEGHFYLTVSQKDKSKVAVQMPASDIYQATTHMLRQLNRNDPDMSPQEILRIVRNVADMHNLKVASRIKAVA